MSSYPVVAAQFCVERSSAKKKNQKIKKIIAIRPTYMSNIMNVELLRQYLKFHSYFLVEPIQQIFSQKMFFFVLDSVASPYEYNCWQL